MSYGEDLMIEMLINEAVEGEERRNDMCRLYGALGAKTWISANGTTISIRKMDDRHIRNCIAMLQRNLPFYDECFEGIAQKYIALFEKERKVTAVIRRRIASGGRTIGGATRRTVARPLLGVASLRSITTLRITAAVTVAFGIPKVNIVGYNLGGSALVAVVVLPVADLQPPLDDRHTSLAEIFADEFSGSSPGNDVDEIRFLFPGLAFEIAVAGDGEAGHRKTRLRTPQLWVAGQSTHDDDLIQHRP